MNKHEQRSSNQRTPQLKRRRSKSTETTETTLGNMNEQQHGAELSKPKQNKQRRLSVLELVRKHNEMEKHLENNKPKQNTKVNDVVKQVNNLKHGKEENTTNKEDVKQQQKR